MRRSGWMILLSLLAASCSKPTPQDTLRDAFGDLKARYDCMDWQGVRRCYYTVLPQGKSTRLLVALHPAFTPVKMTENVSKLAHLATARGYAVLYPKGIDRQWNDGRVMTEVKTYTMQTDDVGFIDAVTAQAQKKFGLGPGQTTVAGMSNGGMMSLRLACQSERYGSVGAVVANLPKGLRDHCSASPKPMLMIVGTKDKIVDYDGGVLADSGVPTTWGEVESARDTEAFFARRNGCNAPPTETVLADAEIDDTVARRRDYPTCTAKLTAITVEGMAHTWPGEKSRLLAWISTRGAVSQQFNAGEALLDFIEQNKR